MLSGKARYLPYPLDRAVVLENEVPTDVLQGQPPWTTDSDERIFVVMEVSLNEYVQLASAIDAGRDPAYPDQSQYIWWLWNRVIHSMTFCEEMAQCLIDENEALIAALADAMQTNPQLIEAISAAVTAAGGGTPGDAVTPEQAAEDILSENVKDEFGDCLPDELWGGMLYLVQSGNRVITDFFEVIEVASNTLESMEIVSRAIPAAGDYIATAAAFANKLQEFFAEAYVGAYTEAYEQSLACDLFCRARGDCELSPDDIMQVINARLTSPIDIGDFGEIMAGVASGTWVGDEIADVMFLVFFAALIFGQQFGDTVGIRPLNTIISLGADQLTSDNWETLCDCPAEWEYDFPGDLAFSEFTPLTFSGATTTIDADSIDGAGNTGDTAVFLNFEIALTGDVNHVEFDAEWNPSNPGFQFIFGHEGGTLQTFILDGTSPQTFVWDGAQTGSHTYNVLAGVSLGAGSGGYLRVVGMRWAGFGTDPFA